MATIRQKDPGQWHVQIRKKGWPTQTATKRTEQEAIAWANVIEADMIRGVKDDQTPAFSETYGAIVKRYLKDVTDNRPGEESRHAEKTRLERFLREEKALCSYAVGHLTWKHFEEWRDRRLTETVARGKEGGRGQYKPVEHKPKLRADGTPVHRRGPAVYRATRARPISSSVPDAPHRSRA